MRARGATVRGGGRGRGSLRGGALGAWLLVAAASPLAGQVVRGEAVEEETLRPLSGALVLLVAEDGRIGATALAGPDGGFVLRPPAPGRYLLELRMIGVENARSPLLEVRTDRTTEYRFEAAIAPVELDGIRAEGEGRCRLATDLGAATATLWEEARKAITIAEWVRADPGVPYQTLLFERTRNVVSLSVEESATRAVSGVGRRPFLSRTSDDLAERGYTRSLGDDSYQYFGLDGSTLLSDGFLATHCFRIEEPADEGSALVGLAFEPVPSHHPPDIEGVLWLDRTTAELRWVEFRYTRHLQAFPVPGEVFGGRMDFARMDNGAWVVSRWWLRMPQQVGAVRGGLGTETRPTQGARDRRLAAHARGLRVREEGGEVGWIGAPGTPPTGSAAVEGIVWDSTAAAPLAGATVLLVGSRRWTRTDSRGQFHLSGLAGGPDSIAFIHPRADDLLLPVAPRAVVLESGAAVRADLHLPAGPGCATWTGDGPPAWIAGVVLDRATGGALDGVPVAAEWRSRNAAGWGVGGGMRRNGTTTAAGGRFHLCVPPEAEVRLTAERGGATATTELTVEGLRPIRRDLVVR